MAATTPQLCTVWEIVVCFFVSLSGGGCGQEEQAIDEVWPVSHRTKCGGEWSYDEMMWECGHMME